MYAPHGVTIIFLIICLLRAIWTLTDCGDHGRLDNGECICSFGYKGYQCEEISQCVKGREITGGGCMCDDGWIGDRCAQIRCIEGEAINASHCKCSELITGLFCDECIDASLESSDFPGCGRNFTTSASTISATSPKEEFYGLSTMWIISIILAVIVVILTAAVALYLVCKAWRNVRKQGSKIDRLEKGEDSVPSNSWQNESTNDHGVTENKPRIVCAIELAVGDDDCKSTQPHPSKEPSSYLAEPISNDSWKSRVPRVHQTSTMAVETVSLIEGHDGEGNIDEEVANCSNHAADDRTTDTSRTGESNDLPSTVLEKDPVPEIRKRAETVCTNTERLQQPSGNEIKYILKSDKTTQTEDSAYETGGLKSLCN